MSISNFSIILGRYWKVLAYGYISLDGPHMSLPKDGNNTIVLMGIRISPYIENLPQPKVNFIEIDLGVYTIFLEEDDDPIVPNSELEDEIWNMHFYGSNLRDSIGASIVLYSPI